MFSNFLQEPTQIVVGGADAAHGWLNTILGPIPGIIAALFAVYLGSRLTEKSARNAEERLRLRDTDVLAASLYAEVSSVMARYRILGALIEKAKSPEELTFGFVEPRFNYFIVFETNAGKIGLLESAAATNVVKFYVLAKGHFEDLITWIKPIREGMTKDSQQKLFDIIKKTHSDILILQNTVLVALGHYSEYVRQQKEYSAQMLQQGKDWYEAAERDVKRE
jgi:hypothetical protein